jgi:hypothetical protein
MVLLLRRRVRPRLSAYSAAPYLGPRHSCCRVRPSEWSFIATFVPADGKGQRAQRVGLDPSGDGRFMLVAVGATDTYDVTLFGKGDGDLVVTFRWTTPRDGPSVDLRSVSQPCQSGTS